MKQILIFILFFPVLLAAQDYDYEIKPEPGDSTFQIDVISHINPSRSDIQRTTGLDTAALQQLQYSRIQAAYNKIAEYEQQIIFQNSLIRTLRQSLTDIGLEKYNQDQVTKLDSFFVAPGWALTNSAGGKVVMNSQYRRGNTTTLRDRSNNAVVAMIMPFSPRLIRLNISAQYRQQGVDSVILYAINAETYRGEDANGVRYSLTRLTR